MAHQLQLYHVSPVRGWTQLTPLSPYLTRNGSGISDGVVVPQDGGHGNHPGQILGASTGQHRRSIIVQLVAVGHVVKLQVVGNV